MGHRRGPWSTLLMVACVQGLALGGCGGCGARSSSPPPNAPNEGARSASASPSRDTAIDPARAAAFWTWFRRNATELATVTTGDEPPADALAEALHRVHPTLTFEIGQVDDAHELVVSADGNAQAFPAVRELVAAAPPLPGWKVTAFRQRQPDPLIVKLGDVQLDPKDVWFRAQPDPERPGKLEVLLFIRGLTAANTTALVGPALLLLDSTLGEYDVETKVGGLDLQPLPPSPASVGLRPLADLPSLVDAMK